MGTYERNAAKLLVHTLSEHNTLKFCDDAARILSDYEHGSVTVPEALVMIREKRKATVHANSRL